MGKVGTILRRTILGPETRAVYPWNVFGSDDYGQKTASGQNISETTAFKYSVVWAAVTLIADGVSSLPPVAYNVKPDGSRMRVDVPQWIRKPHPEIRRYDIWNQLLISMLVWGNGYAQFVRRQSDGVITGLRVIDPSTITCEWDPDRPGYRRYKENNGRWMTSYEVFHVQGPSLPGRPKGMSVITQARESIALGLTLEEFGARYFAQGSQAKIILELPNAVTSEDKAKEIIKIFELFHRGRSNWHRPAIASGGAKIHNVSIPPEDAQFLESRVFQAIDVARWFRVPAHRVGIVDKQSSWGSGLAEENQAMLQHTFVPWILRLQDGFTAYTAGGEASGLLVELDSSALLQGTYTDKVDVTVKMYQAGIISKNEARATVGYSTVSGGDEFITPNAVQSQDSPRTKEQDRIRKQEEAARSKPVRKSWEKRASVVTRTIERGTDFCNRCANNTNPNRVPVHPGCNCDVITNEVETGVADPDSPMLGLIDRASGVLEISEGELPDALRMAPETVAILDIDESRFGDVAKWLEQIGLPNGDYIVLATDDSRQLWLATGIKEDVA